MSQDLKIALLLKNVTPAHHPRYAGSLIWADKEVRE